MDQMEELRRTEGITKDGPGGGADKGAMVEGLARGD